MDYDNWGAIDWSNSEYAAKSTLRMVSGYYWDMTVMQIYVARLRYTGVPAVLVGLQLLQRRPSRPGNITAITATASVCALKDYSYYSHGLSVRAQKL
jgi:hypothetical protein